MLSYIYCCLVICIDMYCIYLMWYVVICIDIAVIVDSYGVYDWIYAINNIETDGVALVSGEH